MQTASAAQQAVTGSPWRILQQRMRPEEPEFPDEVIRCEVDPLWCVAVSAARPSPERSVPDSYQFLRFYPIPYSDSSDSYPFSDSYSDSTSIPTSQTQRHLSSSRSPLPLSIPQLTERLQKLEAEAAQLRSGTLQSLR